MPGFFMPVEIYPSDNIYFEHTFYMYVSIIHL